MAKAQFGITVSDLRKKLGGVVYSANRGGSYVRTKTIPTPSSTSYQIAVRAALTEASNRYSQTLTETQRLAWIAFAANWPKNDVFGNPHPLSGHQMHSRLNTPLLELGLSPIDDPPLDLSVLCPSTFTAAADANTQALEISTLDHLLDSNHTLQVWATMPLGPGRRFVYPFLRALQNFTGPLSPPLDLTAAYATRFSGLFGDPPHEVLPFTTGQKIGLAIRAINHLNGAESPRIIQPIAATGATDVLLERTTNLTTNDLLNLIATPIEIIPAPGANKIINLIGVVLKYTFNTTPFTIPNPGQFTFTQDPSFPLGTFSDLDMSGIVDESTNRTRQNNVWFQASDISSFLENLPLMISQNSGAELTTGDGSLQVTAYYTTTSTP